MCSIYLKNEGYRFHFIHTPAVRTTFYDNAMSKGC